MCNTSLNFAQQQSIDQLMRMNNPQQLGLVQVECGGCKRNYLLSQVR